LETFDADNAEDAMKGIMRHVSALDEDDAATDVDSEVPGAGLGYEETLEVTNTFWPPFTTCVLRD
jgi:hypothetical protein